MRVLIVSHSFNEAGRFKLLEAIGAEATVTLLTVSELDAPAWGVMPAQPSTPRVKVLANVPWRIGGRHLFRPMWRAYREARPDVIHVEYDPWTPEFWSAMLPLLLLHPRTPWVICTRKNTRHIPGGLRGMAERLATRAGLARTARVLTVSKMTGDVFRGLGYDEDRLAILHNVPIDERVFDGRPAGRQREVFRVGYVGSLLPHKGVETLVQAIELLRPSRGEIELHLAGRRQDPLVAEQVTRHSWTTHHGQIPNLDLPEFLAELDVFVMPSLVLPDHQEHDGVALLEAMAMELPCVGSRSGIIGEILVHQENGLLFAPGDAEDLARQLETLMSEPELRELLGKRARKAAIDRVGLTTLASAWVRTYESVT